MRNRNFVWVFGLIFAAATAELSADENAVDYARQIRPILAANCFDCHGPDPNARKGNLRLDQPDGWSTPRSSGRPVVAPGRPEDSELYRRITSDDPAYRMPPANSGKVLTEAQIELIRRWIEQGAHWEQHWSFRPIRRPVVPLPSGIDWCAGPIDAFVLERLNREGVRPSPQADRYVLVRRLYLDLLGIPPTPEEADAFVSDPRPDALERLVDRLLNRVAFGERWARIWLDLARYADTQGYEKDARRTIWRYRDWLIDALNADMPYDQFTIEQLAGDLLPNPTLDQLIATAFHRNTMTNTEGGTDDEEFRVEAVADRVQTTMQVWMGLTFQCARCHNHKYDPISQKEYYEIFAFFNNTADSDRPDEYPTIETPTRLQMLERERLKAELAAARADLAKKSEARIAAFEAWLTNSRARLAAIDEGHWYMTGPISDPARLTADVVASLDLAQDPVIGERYRWQRVEAPRVGENPGLYLLARRVVNSRRERIRVKIEAAGPVRLWLDGAQLDASSKKATVLDRTVDLDEGAHLFVVAVQRAAGKWQLAVQFELDGLPGTAARLLRQDEDSNARAREQLWNQWIALAPELASVRARIADLERKLAAIKPPTTPILRELPPDKARKTHVLVRGSFLNPGEEVQPNTPAVFPPFPEDQPRNRLGFARWLVSRDNPLTARVAVNRMWEALWGRGLVVTSEDFGSQGEPPSHPELLDYLAVQFMDHGWSRKAVVREIVTSAAYRQTSAVSPELLARDPYNVLLARGARFRLDAEFLRDQALAAAGLLSQKVGGPSVMPHQPEGVWQVVYSSDRWILSPGEDRYRRGIYTFWRRTSPHPAMVAMDAPSREVCTIRRIRTNTPLQSLVSLNDPQFWEAAQGLARETLRHLPEASVEERLSYAFRRAAVRPPYPEELGRLARLYEEVSAYLARKSPEEVRALATEPIGPVPEGMSEQDLAAWSVVCNVLLNLDAVLTRN